MIVLSSSNSSTMSDSNTRLQPLCLYSQGIAGCQSFGAFWTGSTTDTQVDTSAILTFKCPVLCKNSYEVAVVGGK
jgi:hypothetical protein